MPCQYQPLRFFRVNNIRWGGEILDQTVCIADHQLDAECQKRREDLPKCKKLSCFQRVATGNSHGNSYRLTPDFIGKIRKSAEDKTKGLRYHSAKCLSACPSCFLVAPKANSDRRKPLLRLHVTFRIKGIEEGRNGAVTAPASRTGSPGFQTWHLDRLSRGSLYLSPYS
jgi:hypothetical protein